MAKFLIQSRYSNDGLKGLLKEGGTARRAEIQKLLVSVGGRVESFYYAFGDTDLFLIVEVPDNVTAAALSMIVNASGSSSIRLTVLLTPEEIDAAARKSIDYRPPGR
jgi:uncharacterized protein with GYD domain